MLPALPASAALGAEAAAGAAHAGGAQSVLTSIFGLCYPVASWSTLSGSSSEGLASPRVYEEFSSLSSSLMVQKSQ